MVSKALTVWQEAGEELMTPSSVFTRGALRANTRPVQGSLLSDVWLPVLYISAARTPLLLLYVTLWWASDPPLTWTELLREHCCACVSRRAGQPFRWSRVEFLLSYGLPTLYGQVVSTVWSNKWVLPFQDDTWHGHRFGVCGQLRFFLLSLVSHMNIGGCYWSVLMVGVTGGPTQDILLLKEQKTCNNVCWLCCN